MQLGHCQRRLASLSFRAHSGQRCSRQAFNQPTIFIAMPTDYSHDVFISYKRQAQWTPWVRDKFCGQLRAYLQQDLGRPPRIFIDEQMLPGRDLPRDLGENLARYKVIIPLLSKDYFGSEWCIHELDLILDRDAEVLAASSGSQHIVVPIVVHDGSLIPPSVNAILYADFSNFRRTVIASESQLAEDFSCALMKLSPAIEAAIAAAPPFDAKWIAHHRKRFADLQASIVGSGAVATHNFTINMPGPPAAAPRPIIPGP